MIGAGDHKYRRPQIIHDFKCGEKSGLLVMQGIGEDGGVRSGIR